MNKTIEERLQTVEAHLGIGVDHHEIKLSDTPITDNMPFLRLEYANTREVLDCVRVEQVRALERELNAANKVVADAKEYVEEFFDIYPEDGLMVILNRKEIK